MTVPPPDLSVTLAKMDVKLDQLLTLSGDHETRLRKLELTSNSGKSWQVVLANAIMTIANAALAGTMVVGS
ncbi:hypothetical protein [Streptomyces sp. ISBFB 2968]|uniref:hypothetical protein n=1 Tax=Streptomyces sp. ISBFB 2968 TaxID=2903527 RepID=UPI002FDC0ADA